MLTYIIRRLLLIPIVLLGIMVVNFFIIQIAPGGPVEQAIAQISGTAVDATARISGNSQGEVLHSNADNQVLMRVKPAGPVVIAVPAAWIRTLSKRSRYSLVLINRYTSAFGLC